MQKKYIGTGSCIENKTQSCKNQNIILMLMDLHAQVNKFWMKSWKHADLYIKKRPFKKQWETYFIKALNISFKHSILENDIIWESNFYKRIFNF